MTFSHTKTLLTLAVAVAAAATVPAAVHAADYKVENGVTYVHPRFKGSIGAGWVPLKKKPVVARNENQRREAVAGFRVETDEKGRAWVWRHPRFKGAIGAGWERVPLDRVLRESE